MDQQQFCLRWNNHGSTLVAVFDNLLASESLVDVTLFAEGHLLKAHKVVLSACSPYFQRVFAETQDRHPIVVLKDVGHRELRALLEYMYRGEVNVAQDQLEPLIRTAESLRIKGLADGPRGTAGPAPRTDTDAPTGSPLSGAGAGTPGPAVPSQAERVKTKSESCPGEPRGVLGEARGPGEGRAGRVGSGDGFPLAASSVPSVPSVLSTVLTMPPALTLAAAAAAAPLVPKMKLEGPAPPLDSAPGSPLAKRRRKARQRSGEGGGDSGGDSDGRSPASPGDPLQQLPRIPATITPVAPLHYGALLRDDPRRDDDRGGGGGSVGGGSSSVGGGGGSSSPSPDSLGGSTRGDSAPTPNSPLPRPLSAHEHSSPSPFKSLAPRHDDNSSDANHHSDDEADPGRGSGGAGHDPRDDNAGPSTSRLPPDDPPHTPSYLGWPYPQDPPTSSEDSAFPSLENTNQGLLLCEGWLATGLWGGGRGGRGGGGGGGTSGGGGGGGGRETNSNDATSGGGGGGGGTTHSCPKCGRSYTLRSNLSRHMRLECGVERRYRCAFCHKRFSHAHHLRSHERSIHAHPTPTATPTAPPPPPTPTQTS